MEPIFKVGEKVRVKRRIGNSNDYKYTFVDDMAELSGKIFTINSYVFSRYVSSGIIISPKELK